MAKHHSELLMITSLERCVSLPKCDNAIPIGYLHYGGTYIWGSAFSRMKLSREGLKTRVRIRDVPITQLSLSKVRQAWDIILNSCMNHHHSRNLRLAVEMIGVQACSKDSKNSYSSPPMDLNWPSTSIHFIALPSWALLLCRSAFFESRRSSYKENLTP